MPHWHIGKIILRLAVTIIIMCDNSSQFSILLSIKFPGPRSLLCVFAFYVHCIKPGSDTVPVTNLPFLFAQLKWQIPVSFRSELNCSVSSISSNCSAKHMASRHPTNAARDKVFIFTSSLDCRKRSSVSFTPSRRWLKGATYKSNKIEPKMNLPLPQYRSKLLDERNDNARSLYLLT